MIELLTETQKHLSSSIPEIKYVDEDWGQLDDFGNNPPVKWPCILVDVSDVQWSNQANYLQVGTAQLRIQVANLKLTNSSSNAPASQKAHAWKIFNLLNDVQRALQGYRANSQTGPLVRTSTRRIRRTDGIQLYEVLYRLQIIDDCAKPAQFNTELTTVEIAV